MTHTHLSAGNDDVREALLDVKSHRDAWRSAILKQQTPFGSDDDGSYWAHELRAFDRTFAALEKIVLNEPQPPREGLAAELMAFHDLCTQNSAGGDGEYRVECSSGSGEQARALRAVLREAAAALALSRPQSKGDQ